MKKGKACSLSVDLRGKLSLVTGSSRGIGQAIALNLATNGSDVIVNYQTSEAQAHEVVEKIRSLGVQSVGFQADVSSVKEVERMIQAIEQQMRANIDILVNNAGTPLRLSSIEDISLELWNRVIAINLTGAMLCSRCIIPGMKEKKWGRIINVSSISARSGGGPGGIPYASSKAGLSGFTKGLAKELGPTGITVNAIAPGVIMTEIHEKFSTKESLKSLKKLTPLGRLGKPEDVSGAVLFLASESASYITGETIAINGGLRMD